MKKTITILARSAVVATMLLGGAAASEASAIHLETGSSSVDLCLPTLGCGSTFGLSNWIAGGSAVPSFYQWFAGFIESDPAGSYLFGPGTIDTLGNMSYTNPTLSTASVSFGSSPVGFTVNYELKEIAGISHILESVIVDNFTALDWYNVALTDGMDLDWNHSHPANTHWTIAELDYTPTPEPMSMVLLGTGLIGVVRSRRRKTAIA